ncbi:MAG: hypothetical protein BGO25_09265 [Acidobacteriales bacterium 59-55]|nr:MAG: hypothetical protein BGO25_09265 [Acidobacteriales bacterium 59-55]
MNTTANTKSLDAITEQPKTAREVRTVTTKTVRETEAEAVAFVVGKAVGLVTGTASADYIHLYHGKHLSARGIA